MGVQKAKKVELLKWSKLEELIGKYADAVVADSWKGGGDPQDIPLVEAQLLVAKLELERYIELLKQEYT